MIDEEYFAGQEFGFVENGTMNVSTAFFSVPFYSGPSGLRHTDGGSNIFPAGFLQSLKASRGLTRDARDTETPEDQKYPISIDHFRAGMMRLWLHNFLPFIGVSELQWAFTAAGEGRRKFIPLTLSPFEPTIFRDSDLSSTTKYRLRLKDNFEHAWKVNQTLGKTQGNLGTSQNELRKFSHRKLMDEQQTY